MRLLVYEKFENPYEAFQEAVESGEEVFTKQDIAPDWASALTEVARSKVKLEKASLTATVELTCRATEGIEAIRAALSNAIKVKKPRGATIRVYAVGAPRYRIEATTREYSEAEAVLKAAVEEATNTVKSSGGEGRRVS